MILRVDRHDWLIRSMPLYQQIETNPAVPSLARALGQWLAIRDQSL